MSGKRVSLGDRNLRPRDILFGSEPILPDMDKQVLFSDKADVEPLQKIKTQEDDEVKVDLPSAESQPIDNELIPPIIQRQAVVKHNFFITPEQNRWINNVCKNYAIENRSALLRHILDTYRTWMQSPPDEV